jgi:P27 family predicted phage terminase small subunit
MRGRKPESIEFKILKGERADRINLDAPPALPGRPECPDHLSDVAREEWDRLVEVLDEAKLLSRADGSLLALYCSTFALWVEAKANIAAEGMTTKTDKGSLKVSPYVSIAAVAVNQLGRLLVEFGLSPSARSRLRLGHAEAKKDDLDDFLERQTG